MMKTRSDCIREELDGLKDGSLSTTERIMVLQTEAILELERTLVYIKNNTKDLADNSWRE